MATHSLPPTDIHETAASYLPWGRDLNDWTRVMANQTHLDRDALRKLRAARSVLGGALSEINAVLERSTEND